MQQHTFEIVNTLGFHARASAILVKTSTTFSSDIKLSLDGIQVNGKSIMGVMMLAAAKGSTVQLTVEGPDEATAIQTIGELIKGGFGEY